MRLWVRPLASLSGLRICAVGCGVGYRCGSDPELLWLWCRPAAVTPIGHLAWEPPYATGAALKKTKKKKERPSHLAAHALSSAPQGSVFKASPTQGSYQDARVCTLCVLIFQKPEQINLGSSGQRPGTAGRAGGLGFLCHCCLRVLLADHRLTRRVGLTR